MSNCNTPRVFLTAHAKRSASGSVAIRTSACTRSAYAHACTNAAGSSGLGDDTVGKFPSGNRCSGTVIMENPISPSMRSTWSAPVPCNGVYAIRIDWTVSFVRPGRKSFSFIEVQYGSSISASMIVGALRLTGTFSSRFTTLVIAFISSVIFFS